MGLTLTLTSCSKEDVMEDPAPVVQDLSVNGAWVTDIDIFDANGTIVLEFAYAVDFQNNADNAEGYASFPGDSCFTYDGYWEVVNRTPSTIRLQGAVGSDITLTYVNRSTLSMEGTVAIGDQAVSLAGTLHSQSFTACSGKRVPVPGTIVE